MSATLESWRESFARLPAARRRVLLATVLALALAVLWLFAVAPALRTLKRAGTQRAALQRQAQHMQQLAAEARQLAALPRMGQQEAQRALQQATQQRLGAAARLSAAGDRATVTLTDAPAAALAEWLAEARLNARAVPLEARLQRSAGALTWSGTLTMSLPEP